MAQAIDWHGRNIILNPPKGDEVISSMPVFASGKVVVSCWELSHDEVMEICLTGKIFVAMEVDYRKVPPIAVNGSEEVIREQLTDYGKVWAKKERVK